MACYKEQAPLLPDGPNIRLLSISNLIGVIRNLMYQAVSWRKTDPTSHFASYAPTLYHLPQVSLYSYLYG